MKSIIVWFIGIVITSFLGIYAYASTNTTPQQTEDCINLEKANVITVNCNGIDCFQIEINCTFISYEIKVLNRWGEEIEHFEAPNIQTINTSMNSLKLNDKIPAGTYYATLSCLMNNRKTLDKAFYFHLIKN